MKKIVAILMAMLMVMSVTVVLAGSAAAKDTQPENVVEYTKTLDIVTPEPVIETYLGYHVPRTRGYDFMTEPSVPMLPVKSFSLVIPQIAEIKSIKVVSSTKEELRGDYDIFPVQEPVPTSRNAPVRFTPKNPSIYASSNPYPGKLFEYAGEGNLRDYRILSIFVYPLQYNPAGKKLTLYKNINIEVTYTAPPAEPREIKQDEFTQMVKALVSNPEDVDTLSTATTTTIAPTVLPPDDIDYVIITDSTLEAEFQVLTDWKNSKGITATTTDVSWITSNYDGVDAQERIRNFIKDAKNTWNTKWILLGGDTNVVPHRLAYSDFQDNNEFIPADLYYSDLDGSWDVDVDEIYGEVVDEIDFYPDVFVGRAPVDTTEEANAFVSKTIAYEQGPLGYETTALFMAEYLDIFTDGGIAKNIIDDNYIPDTFSVTKLYESLGNLNHDSAMNELNEGYGIINHVGHGNVGVIGTGPDGLYNPDMDSLINSPRNSVFYSISCLSNAFEQDSFSEHFVLNPDGGGIAYIGNSRYGWFISGSPDGPSDLYDREFFKSLFDESFYHIGETLADSKVTFVPASQSGDTVERWIQYSLNLLGDPETKIWTTSIPKPPELSVTVDAPVRVDVNDIFIVNATISNLGDETATGVETTISWIPESGISTTDSLTQFVGDITGGGSKIVSWTMHADAIGTYDITVTAVDSTGSYSDSDTTTTTVTFPLETVTVVPNSASDNLGNDVTAKVKTSDDIYATLTVRRATGYVEMNFLEDIPDGSTIYSVIFSYEHHETIDNAVYVDVWDGSAWVRHGGAIRSSDTTDSLDVTAEIDTEAEAENSKIRYVCYDGLGGPENCYLDYAELSITYTSSAPEPPELSVTVTAPATVNVDDRFIIDATISNSGEETATGVEATITLPAGLSTTDPQTKPVNDILGGDSATVSWNVDADAEGAYNITVTASATNAATASGTTTVDVITPDTTPPTVILTDPLDNTYITSELYTATATASDEESGVASVEFKYSLSGGLTWISIGTDTTSPYEVIWNLSAIEDQIGILVKAIATNNVGLTAEDINSGIIHDATPPTATISINDGADYTTTTEVTLTLTYSDTISDIDDCRYSNDTLSWSDWGTCTESKAWTLATGDGTKTVYYEVKDNAGNVKQVTDTIILDTTPPTGSVTINNDTTYTTSSVVTLTISATDANGVVEMIISNYGTFSGATWEPYATSKPWTLTTGDGTKTVYVKYKDNAGLVSTIYSDDIILDTTPPAQVGNVIVNTISSSELSISWTANAEEDLVDYNVYRSTISGGPYNLVASPTTNSYLDTGLTASTTYYYKITATDKAGNEGVLSTEASGTTEAAGNVMHIAGIEMSTTIIKLNGWYTYATATVTIVDANNNPVEGATVSGTWSGLTSDTDSGNTDADGQAALDSDSVKNAAGTFTFTVDDVTKTDWIYKPEENVETSDSITV